MDGRIRRLGRFLGLDRNPLRRPVDRVEARIRLLLAAVLVAGGPALTIGLATRVNADLTARAAIERAEFRQVTAVVGEPSAITPALDGSRRQTVDATVRLPDGRARRVRISTSFGTSPGARVPVWINARGEVVTQPITAFDALVTVAFVAVTAPLLLGTALWLIMAGVRAAAVRAAAAAWEREWRLIDRRAGHPGE